MAQLSAADVRDVVFAPAPDGCRGYDEEQVDRFLAAVEQTITDLTRQLAALRGQAVRAPQAASTAAEAAVRAELARIRTRLTRTVDAARSPHVGVPSRD